MAKRVPVGTIGVTRKIGAKNVTLYPKIGQVFDFTDDELKSINAMQKKSGIELVRKPVNEDATIAADGTGGSKPEGTAAADLTVAQLRELAAARNIDLGDATKKDAILALITAAEEEDL